MKKFVLIVFLYSYVMASAQIKIMPEILANQKVMQGNYLPDFSYAGYHYGESSIKAGEATTFLVTDYGAIPDDGLDDSDAIIQTLETARAKQGRKIILFPQGRFDISKIIYIDYDDVILRGTGSGNGGTVLYFPRPLMTCPDPIELKELREYLMVLDKRQKDSQHGIDLPFSQYSWSGGFIWVLSPDSRAKPYLGKYDKTVMQVTKAIAGQRGEKHFIVNKPGSLSIGDIYKLHWFNKEGKEGSFLKHLYNETEVEIGSHHWDYPKRPLVSQVVEVINIIGDTAFIKVPLLHDVKSEWHCVLSPWEHLEEVGIENFSFEFPEAPYIAHHVEQGYNGIYLTGLMHGWVRNISFKNADSGILTDDISNVTIEDIWTTGNNMAHYSVAMGEVQNILVRSLFVKNKVVHPLSFNTRSTRCVYTNCYVDQHPILDQHSGTNHQNLFDNITVFTDHPVHQTYHYPLFKSGGAEYWYPAHGAFNTFWNIHIHFYNPPDDGQSVLLDGITDGASARLVGIHANVPVRIRYEPNAYLERINQQSMIPSLYRYQLRKRISDQTFDDFILLDGRLIERTKNAIQQGVKEYIPAYEQLIKDAEEAMLGGFQSVMDKEFVPPSGTKHDYMTIGPYWWPDPNSSDGLPYIPRDGLLNPEWNKYDRLPMENMMKRVRTLSLAYYFSGEEKYADIAMQLLNKWFLDPNTKMNPHLLYGQAIKGRVTGRDIGIIDTHMLIAIPDAMRLIRESKAYSFSFEAGIRSWFDEYLNWLWNHSYGQGERNRNNNHGTYYDLQTTVFALFVGKMELAKTILSEVPIKRIDVQIEPDGRQPRELDRTKSYNYSMMNLAGFMNLCFIGSKLKIDLINYSGPNGQTIQKALDYMRKFSINTDQWPYEQIVPFEPANRMLYEILLMASILTNNSDYIKAADTLSLEDKLALSANLKYPLYLTWINSQQNR